MADHLLNKYRTRFQQAKKAAAEAVISKTLSFSNTIVSKLGDESHDTTATSEPTHKSTEPTGICIISNVEITHTPSQLRSNSELQSPEDSDGHSCQNRSAHKVPNSVRYSRYSTPQDSRGGRSTTPHYKGSCKYTTHRSQASSGHATSHSDSVESISPIATIHSTPQANTTILHQGGGKFTDTAKTKTLSNDKAQTGKCNYPNDSLKQKDQTLHGITKCISIFRKHFMSMVLSLQSKASSTAFKQPPPSLEKAVLSSKSKNVVISGKQPDKTTTLTEKPATKVGENFKRAKEGSKNKVAHSKQMNTKTKAKSPADSRAKQHHTTKSKSHKEKRTTDPQTNQHRTAKPKNQKDKKPTKMLTNHPITTSTKRKNQKDMIKNCAKHKDRKRKRPADVQPEKPPTKIQNKNTKTHHAEWSKQQAVNVERTNNQEEQERGHEENDENYDHEGNYEGYREEYEGYEKEYDYQGQEESYECYQGEYDSYEGQHEEYGEQEDEYEEPENECDEYEENKQNPQPQHSRYNYKPAQKGHSDYKETYSQPSCIIPPSKNHQQKPAIYQNYTNQSYMKVPTQQHTQHLSRYHYDTYDNYGGQNQEYYSSGPEHNQCQPSYYEHQPSYTFNCTYSQYPTYNYAASVSNDDCYQQYENYEEHGQDYEEEYPYNYQTFLEHYDHTSQQDDYDNESYNQHTSSNSPNHISHQQGNYRSS